MELKMQEMLKKDLKEAVARKDYAKVEQLKTFLNVSNEQNYYIENGLTGYPSVDKVHLKFYSDGAEERALNIPCDKTVWDVIEEKMYEYYDIPAIEYFGKTFSRPEFVELCYTWARTFRAMGVEEGEIVPVYGPTVPDICAMFFALNMIGACPYFLKLAITPDALEEETREAKIAVVYDGMWANVADEFSKDKYKNVIVASVSENMPNPKKEIVSFLSKMQALKSKSKIPDEKKYIWLDKAKDISNYYSGNVKVPFKSDRPAAITSSSGTSGGVVKGTVATNESILGQIISGLNSEIPYAPGETVLNHFPFTASTSMNSLFLLAFLYGMTILIDPRVSSKDFYNQIMKLKPNVALTTGSAWEEFFTRVYYEMRNGKKFDFSFAKGWTVGGEGTDCKKMQLWNYIMEQANAYNLVFSGYGLSELFSAISVENVNNKDRFEKDIISVGIPQAGMTVGIFDENGNELTYNQRGELWIKSPAVMKEYYNKPELTKQTKVNGWVKTGDLAEIDETGLLYIWGRINDSIVLDNSEKLYLFDVANKIKQNEFVKDAVVLNMPTEDNKNNLVAHIVWSDDKTEDLINNIEVINSQMANYLPTNVELSAYSIHKSMLPYSPSTLKKDKNGMRMQKEGYVQVIDGNLNNVEFILNENGNISRNCAIINKDKVKSFIKKVA